MEQLKNNITFTRTLFLSLIMTLSHLSYGQKTPDYFVGLNSGKTIYADRIEFVNKTFGKDYLLLDDSTQYYLADLNFYQRETGYFLKKRVSGKGFTAGGEFWFKRDIEGEISTYSATQWAYTPGMNMSGMYSAGYSTPIKHSYYQKGFSFKEITYENLKRDLDGNKLSMYELDRVRKMNNASKAIYVTSGAMILGGLVHMNALNKQEGPPPYEDVSIKFSPFLILGLTGVAIPRFIKMAKEKKLLNAIKEYNAN